MRSIEALKEECRRLARHPDVLKGIDVEAYKKASRAIDEPVLYGGSLKADVGFFGRDPGRDEIRLGEPLIGAGGSLVRAGLSRAGSPQAFLFNTVPYKPTGNKAWSMPVKKLFHGVISELIVDHFKGGRIFTLGNEAFHWFGIGDGVVKQELLEHFERADRYESSVRLKVTSPASGRSRVVELCPLPHPSPLNATWYKKFPKLLDARLGVN